MIRASAPAGWNEFLLDFLVQTTATADSWISDSHHKMPVFDVRSLPGDTVSFPAVRIKAAHGRPLQDPSWLEGLSAYFCACSWLLPIKDSAEPDAILVLLG